MLVWSWKECSDETAWQVWAGAAAARLGWGPAHSAATWQAVWADRHCMRSNLSQAFQILAGHLCQFKRGKRTALLKQLNWKWLCFCFSNMCRWQLLQVLIQPKRGMLKGCLCSVSRNDRWQALTEVRECTGQSTALAILHLWEDSVWMSNADQEV